MIFVQETNLLSATRKAFLLLSETGNANASDPSILKEDAATLEITNPIGQISPTFIFNDNDIRYTENYSDYFPWVEKDLVAKEIDHYRDLLLSTGRLETITGHLKSSPASRRIVMSVWSDEFMSSQRKESPCLTHLYFRVNNQNLEMHAHFRANDAYRLLLMDMQLATSVQWEISQRIGLTPTRYIHQVNSLHFYKHHRQDIIKQKRYFAESEIWSY